MNEMHGILNQAQNFFQQHAPARLVAETAPLAIFLLIAGIAVSVLGAKLARFGITTLFLCIGALIGHHLAPRFTLQPMYCMLIGGLVAGLIAFLGFRIWVGVLCAVVFSSLAMGFFSYHRVLPHFFTFEKSNVQVSAPSSGASSFTILSQEQQKAYLDRTPREWANEFWSFVISQDRTADRDAKAIGAAALVTGLLFGLIAVRWALVLSTAALGTALVTSSLGTLSAHYVPESYQAFVGRPAIGGIALAALFLTSLILQARLTRKSSNAKSSPKS